MSSGRAGAMEVVVQEPANGPISVLCGIRLGLSPCMLADQVVEPVAALRGFPKQVLVVEGFQAAAGGREAAAA